MKKLITMIVLLVVSINCFASIKIASDSKSYAALAQSMLFNYYLYKGIDVKKLYGNAEINVSKDDENYRILFKLQMEENAYTFSKKINCNKVVLDVLIYKKDIEKSIKNSNGEILVSEENEAVLRFVNNFIGGLYDVKKANFTFLSIKDGFISRLLVLDYKPIFIEKDYHAGEQTWYEIINKTKKPR